MEKFLTSKDYLLLSALDIFTIYTHIQYSVSRARKGHELHVGHRTSKLVYMINKVR